MGDVVDLPARPGVKLVKFIPLDEFSGAADFQRHVDFHVRMFGAEAVYHMLRENMDRVRKAMTVEQQTGD